MLGNAAEWVNDWYDKNYYQNSPYQDPSGPLDRDQRVFRGGSLINSSGDNRVSCRTGDSPNLWYSSGGFRCGGQPASP
jgi:formylglycine-generating enzyme required for sulfatase activity